MVTVVNFAKGWEERSRKNLLGVHPNLVLLVGRALFNSPYHWAVTEGVRSIERQKKLFAEGKSLTMHSKHLLQPDGYGHAVDIMLSGDLNDDGVVDAKDASLVWSKPLYTNVFHAWNRASTELDIAFRWGGSFQNFFDGPHYELVINAT